MDKSAFIQITETEAEEIMNVLRFVIHECPDKKVVESTTKLFDSLAPKFEEVFE